MYLFIPKNIDYIVLKHSVDHNNFKYIVCIYNLTYSLFIVCKDLIKMRGILIVKILFYKRTPLFNNLKLLEDLLTRWVVISNIKIKFSGKGYKLVKQNNCFKLYLNTSHPQ